MMDDQTISRTFRAWQCFALAVLISGLYVVITARTYVYQDATGPGPGFFPVWIGGITAIVALVLLLTLRRQSILNYASWEWPTREPAIRVITTIASIGGTALLLHPAGFRLTMFLFLVVQLWCFGVKPWWKVLLVAAGGSLVTHYVFQSLLRVQLPEGPFGM